LELDDLIVTRIPPVVVTAAKRSQLLEEAFTSVALVAQEQLASRAVHTVDEAVDKAPGVLMLNGQINIRGSTGYVQGIGSRVLLLVDGVPANQGDRGGISWDLVPLDEIERVEIVKGAGSALYGSSALGGVVNLITRDIATGTHVRLRATGGAFADPPHPEWRFRPDPGMHGRVDATASHGAERWAASAGGGYQHSDGYREQDARDRWHVHGRGRWVSRDARTVLDVSGAWTRDDYLVPLQWCVQNQCDTGGQAYQPFRVDTALLGDRTVSHKGYAQAVIAREPTERLRWQARASWLRTRFVDHQRSGDDHSIANKFGLEGRGVARPPGDRVVTTVGGELAHAEITGNFFGDHTQGEYAAYAESERRLGDTRLSLGARLDFLAVDGGGLRAVLSPRGGLVIGSGWGATRLSAGRAFRAPSLAERFVSSVIGPFVAVPNPALQPETAWSFEIGHHAAVGPVAVDAAVFWTEADQLIEPVIDPGTFQIQFRNLARARLAGLDLAATATPLAGFAVTLGYTYLSARELAQAGRSEQPLGFRPRHLATLGADYHVGPATVGADFRYMSRFERVPVYEGEPRVATTVLDLRAAASRGPFQARLLVANALNYIHALVPRTLAPVRTVSLTVGWSY
jgi:iron complex outermembrane receptor protein